MHNYGNGSWKAVIFVAILMEWYITCESTSSNTSGIVKRSDQEVGPSYHKYSNYLLNFNNVYNPSKLSARTPNTWLSFINSVTKPTSPVYVNVFPSPELHRSHNLPVSSHRPKILWTSTPRDSVPAKNPTGCGDNLGRKCPKNRYRSFDGSCNNLQNPTWGMSNTRFGRLARANYGDGIQSPTRSVSGSPLPPARLVSEMMFPVGKPLDKKWTLASMQWGQIMTHDMALTAGITQTKHHTSQCCSEDGTQLTPAVNNDPQCFPVLIPSNDPVYGPAGIRCFNFIRTATDRDRGCLTHFNQPAEQITAVTSYLDASLVYGSDDQTAANLRARVGGRLRVEIRNRKQWPPSSTNRSMDCSVDNDNEICYAAGDVRVNQNTHLTVFQILLLREHNRIADRLAELNPSWKDETIFQEARRILIAEYQHISYYEWLPIFLGERQTYESGILFKTDGFVNDYDSNVKAGILNEHSTAAFRYFHSLIAGWLKLVTELRYSFNDPLRLSDHFNKPAIIESRDEIFDELVRGLAYQPQEASDRLFDAEIKQYLFRHGRPLGMDLRAIDIQRNRDHGLASYNDMREYCGLPRASSFEDLQSQISYDDIFKLSQLYESPDDIELTVGGSLERHVPGTLSGPTFLCIMIDQFKQTRVGDRFWYETGNPKLKFTVEQLAEIRKASISRIFCDNSDNVQSIQMRGFELIGKRNPIVSCAEIPEIDLTAWKDVASQKPPTPARPPNYNIFHGANHYLPYRIFHQTDPFTFYNKR